MSGKANLAQKTLLEPQQTLAIPLMAHNAASRANVRDIRNPVKPGPVVRKVRVPGPSKRKSKAKRLSRLLKSNIDDYYNGFLKPDHLDCVILDVS